MKRSHTFSYPVDVVFNLVVEESTQGFKKIKEGYLGSRSQGMIKNQLGQPQVVIHEITGYQPPQIFEITTTNSQETYTQKYMVGEREGRAVLTYSEEYQGVGLLRNINNWVMRIVYRGRIKHKTHSLFRYLESRLESMNSMESKTSE